MKMILYTPVTLLMLLAACSPPASGPAPGSLKVEADGVTPTLSRSMGPALYNLEQINSVVEPLNHQQRISVSANDQLTVIGWAVDQNARKQASGVEIVVDGKAYRAKADLNRPDVSDHFKVQDYLKAGFNFSADAGAFGKGTHQLAVRIVSNDGKSYFESPSVAVNVE